MLISVPLQRGQEPSSFINGKILWWLLIFVISKEENTNGPLCIEGCRKGTLRIYAQYMGLPSNGHRNNHRLETHKIILIVEPEQKVASIQKGIESITPKRNRFFGPSPPQIKFTKIRVTGAKKGCASIMKKSKSEVLHNPIQ